MFRRDLIAGLVGAIVASSVLLPIGWWRVRAERDRVERDRPERDRPAEFVMGGIVAEHGALEVEAARVNRELEEFQFSIHTNTVMGFEKANQLTLRKDGKIFSVSGPRVSDDDLGIYCMSEPGKKDQKLRLLLLEPGDTSAGKLVAALESIQKAAGERKIHLAVSVLTRSPSR